MARADYIWVAIETDGRHRQIGICGTWTVKHEMVAWLRRLVSTNGIAVLRYRDCDPKTPGKYVAIVDLLACS